MKKLIAFVLAGVLLMTGLCIGVSAETPMTRDSAYFTNYGTSISTAGSGRLYITFRAVGTCLCNQIGVANYQVEKLTSEGWVNVSGLLDGQTGCNVASYTFGRVFQGVPGETYRVRVSFLCTIDNCSEVKSYTSGKITAK